MRLAAIQTLGKLHSLFERFVVFVVSGAKKSDHAREIAGGKWKPCPDNHRLLLRVSDHREKLREVAEEQRLVRSERMACTLRAVWANVTLCASGVHLGFPGALSVPAVPFPRGKREFLPLVKAFELAHCHVLDGDPEVRVEEFLGG